MKRTRRGQSSLQRMFCLRGCGELYCAWSCAKYRPQPSFFQSCMYEASCAMAPLRGGSFLTQFYGNGAMKFDELSDIPTISNFLEISTNGNSITQTGCKIFRRFRATAWPIVTLNSLRRIDASTTNKPHSLTKHKIQTQTAKLGQSVRQIAAANDC